MLTDQMHGELYQMFEETYDRQVQAKEACRMANAEVKEMKQTIKEWAKDHQLVPRLLVRTFKEYAAWKDQQNDPNASDPAYDTLLMFLQEQETKKLSN